MNEREEPALAVVLKTLTQILIDAGWIKWDSPQALMEAAMMSREGHESQQAEKTQTRYTYTEGPMLYIGQQIVRAMQDAGYPAKIAEYYRTPERQAELLAKRPPVTKAGPWQSAHQYYCAVDIIHPSKGWDVSEAYWETLATCVRNVSLKLGVALDHGHHWRFRDSAHVQLEDWKDFKALVGESTPTPEDLQDLWEVVLPEVWRRYMQRQTEKGNTVDGRLPL